MPDLARKAEPGEILKFMLAQDKEDRIKFTADVAKHLDSGDRIALATAILNDTMAFAFVPGRVS